MLRTMARTKTYPRLISTSDGYQIKDHLERASESLEIVAMKLTKSFGPNNRMATGAAGLALACERLEEKASGFVEKPVDKSDPSDII